MAMFLRLYFLILGEFQLIMTFVIVPEVPLLSLRQLLPNTKQHARPASVAGRACL